MANVEHLYLHIPFCHRVCPYCAFYKHLPGATDLAAFVEAVIQEAKLYGERIPLALKTVYLGGGTPTFLSETHLDRLLCGLRKELGWSELEEFCIEVNPRTITANKAALLVRHGLSRASIGVQAWDSETLATLGRDHTPDEATETFATLRDAGVKSLNLDLMFSIPGQSLQTWSQTLAQSLRLKPDHISAYNLNYEEDTDFFDKLTSGHYSEEPERDAEFFYLAMDRLEQAGFEHYEISNYAQPNHQSAHNAGYWSGKDYLGLGPSAVSTHGNERWKNVPDTKRYVEAIQACILPKQDAEHLSDEKRHIERVALELRTSRGLDMERLRQVPAITLDMLVDEDLILIGEDQRARLTRKGKALADTVAGELIG